MNQTPPAYLSPYVLTGTFAIAIAVWYLLRRSVRLAGWPHSDTRRAMGSITSLLVAWLGLALLISWSGFYRATSSRIPTIQYGILLPILAGVMLFWLWPVLRRALESAPQEWLVRVQLYRTLGAIFLVLYAGGRLPGLFAWPAGLGDILVGLLAPVVALAYRRKTRGAASLVRAWNFLGIADLVVAVGTGFLTAPSLLQQFAFDSPNQLISQFPLVLVPTFLVPLSILLHLASLRKLRLAAQPLYNAK